MGRAKRYQPGGLPQHVYQRGHNRAAVFHDDGDRRFYLAALGAACERFSVALHAYVLMDNHIHLLATPATEGGLSRAMQLLGRNYVRRSNEKYVRSGSLWESRFKSAAIDSERYLFTCQRYIELNPVRAGMVARPADYHWSSYGGNAQIETRVDMAPEALIRPHQRYLDLAPDPAGRAAAYRGMFAEALSEDTLETLRKHIRRQRPLL